MGEKKKQQQTFLIKFMIQLIAVLGCSAILIHSMNYNLSQIMIGKVVVEYSNIPVIIIAAIFGFVPAMISFLIVFLYEAIVDAGLSYSVFIYLLAASLTYIASKKGAFRSKKKAVLSTFALAIVLGNVWDIILRLINAQGFTDLTIGQAFLYFATELPECFLSVLIISLLVKILPMNVKQLIYVGTYDTDDCPSSMNRASKLSHKIMALIVAEALVLGISAAFFANLLMPNLSDYTVDVNNNGTTTTRPESTPQNSSTLSNTVNESYREGGDVERYWITQRFLYNYNGIAFDVKIILLLLNVAVPFIVISNYYAQYVIARPISRMAKTMSNFSDMENSNRREELEEVHNLNIRQEDEIGELYQALDKMATEITNYVDSVKREQKLEAELLIAQKSSETKTQFLNNMSHEIRTPINAILGFDELILRESTEDTTLNYASDIQNAGKTLLNIVNEILDSSKLEAGKLEIIPVEYELGSTINDLVNMIQVKAKEKNLELKVEVNPTIPHYLYGDEIRFKQVIINILSNAVKYTEKGNVTLALDYQKVDEEHILFHVKVSDTGIGIKQEDFSKLFMQFERIEEERNRSIEGTGLGMSIVQQLLALMDSKLDVTSEYGKGSTFSFDMIQKVIRWSPIGDFNELYNNAIREENKYHESFHAPNAKILVVDDTQLNLTVVEGLLKPTQIQIDSVLSGKEAIEFVLQKKYDLIFLDHRMPQLDGVETLKVMHQLAENLNEDTPVIALTANAISGARETYLAAGFHDYLSKPIDGRHLEKMLRQYLPKDKLITGERLLEDSNESDMKEKEVQIKQLQGIAGIDYTEAIKNCGTEEIFLKVMKEFLGFIPDKSKEIEQFYQKQDFHNYTIRVHALKSSARLVGAMRLSTMAAELEAAGDKEDSLFINEHTPELLQLYRSYFDKIMPLLSYDSKDGDARPLISEEELQGAYDAIKEFVEAFDFDSADEVMGMLDDYKIPQMEEERYQNIHKALADVDREEILKFL